jgi:hypothetical protein
LEGEFQGEAAWLVDNNNNNNSTNEQALKAHHIIMLARMIKTKRLVAARPLVAARFQSSLASNGTADDYPKVEPDLYYNRDPDLPWDDPQNRRNIGQTLHPDDDILNLWSPHYYDAVKDSTAVKWQLIFFAGLAGFSGLMYLFFYPERKAIPRTYPDGLARDFGARNEKEGELYGVRVDKSY